jgi:hypothetical protein
VRVGVFTSTCRHSAVVVKLSCVLLLLFEGVHAVCEKSMLIFSDDVETTVKQVHVNNQCIRHEHDYHWESSSIIRLVL